MSFETYEVRVFSNGTKVWRQNDQRHRLDGPAVEDTDGYKAWYQNGQRHRLDGPAIEYADGGKGWCIKGVAYTESDFNKKIKRLNGASKTCANKTVEIDGIKYKLVAVETSEK